MKKLSPYSFLGRVFKNWHIKLIAFLLAVVVYVICFYAINQNRIVDIPLDIVENSAFKNVSNVPEKVSLNIVGKDEAIYIVDASKIKAMLDFSSVNAEGVYTFPVTLSYDKGIMKTDIVDITVNPLTVRVKFESR